MSLRSAVYQISDICSIWVSIFWWRIGGKHLFASAPSLVLKRLTELVGEVLELTARQVGLPGNSSCDMQPESTTECIALAAWYCYRPRVTDAELNSVHDDKLL